MTLPLESPTANPLVAISILNWNGWQDTLQCLESVRRLDYPNYLTIVVDNGSCNGSADRIKAWAKEGPGPGCVIVDYTRETALAGGDLESEKALDSAPSSCRMVLIRNDSNLGFTGGHNVAIHYALSRRVPPDSVFLLNNDAKVEARCVSHLVSVALKADAGIVGAIVTKANGEPYFAGSRSFQYHLYRSLISTPVHTRKEEYWDSPIAYGAAVLISRDALSAIRNCRGEYLKESLFAYGDEIELCWAAYREGFRTVIAKNALVSHDSAVRSGQPRDSRYFFYYSTRNNILIAKDNLRFRHRLAFHSLYPPLCLRRIVKRLVARQPHLALAIVFGLLDGYRGVDGMWKSHAGHHV